MSNAKGVSNVLKFCNTLQYCDNFGIVWTNIAHLFIIFLFIFLSLLSLLHLIHSFILSSSPSILPTFVSLSQPLILSINPSNRILTINNQNHASVQSSSATVLPTHPLKSDLLSNLIVDLSFELATDYYFGLTHATIDLANPHRNLASPLCRSC